MDEADGPRVLRLGGGRRTLPRAPAVNNVDADTDVDVDGGVVVVVCGCCSVLLLGWSCTVSITHSSPDERALDRGLRVVLSAVVSLIGPSVLHDDDGEMTVAEVAVDGDADTDAVARAVDGDAVVATTVNGLERREARFGAGRRRDEPGVVATTTISSAACPSSLSMRPTTLTDVRAPAAALTREQVLAAVVVVVVVVVVVAVVDCGTSGS
jgi:hypothetical protein